MKSDLDLLKRCVGFCPDCGAYLRDDDRREVYEVTEAVRFAARLERNLCVGCLENRLGRQLVPTDFPDCDLNRQCWNRTPRGSQRLMERLGLQGTLPIAPLIHTRQSEEWS